MPPGLWREIWILIAIALGSLAAGAITGRPFIVAAIGFGLYIASSLRHLVALHHWLTRRRAGELPDAEGLWGEVFAQIERLVRRAERRQGELAGLLGRFQEAAAVMPDAVVIVSQHETIEWANPAARDLLGIDYPRDVGQRLTHLLRYPDVADYLGRAQFAEPLEIAAPGTTDKFLSLQVIPFGASQKLILARDVTRVKQLEQMRTQFIADASHELRTPLTVFAGYVETLSEMPEIRPEALREHLAAMTEQVERMQRLVSDLLLLSRLETAPPRRVEEVVDVPALARALLAQAQILSGGQHEITLQADERLRLRGSRDELASAFMNLLSNAVQYTPAGGRIAIRWFADEEGTKFVVSDTGEGIAPEHLPHLTERFYRVDTARSRAHGGTGLGLSIVKHVLLRHQARLAIQSAPGQGSTFSCVFPAARLVREEDTPAATP
jgi:two-component system phosphate regulon sensor histidine kinase PhoR